MKKAIKHILYILLTAIAFTYCSEDDTCPDSNVPLMAISFENASLQDFDTTFVYISELGDTLFRGNTNPDTLKLPLKLSDNSTSLNFDMQFTDSTPLIKDLITISHNYNIYSTDLECGIVTEFTINEIKASSNFIDSIEILNSVINSDELVHAKIYY